MTAVDGMCAKASGAAPPAAYDLSDALSINRGKAVVRSNSSRASSMKGNHARDQGCRKKSIYIARTCLQLSPRLDGSWPTFALMF